MKVKSQLGLSNNKVKSYFSMKGRCNNKSKRRKVSRKASKWQKLSEKLESMLTAVILSSLMLISTKSQSKTSLELLLATKSINRKNQCNLSKKKPGNNKVYWIIYREKMISIQKVFYIYLFQSYSLLYFHYLLSWIP